MAEQGSNNQNRSTDKAQIGKYKIISKVGEGGMGRVYKAIHPTLKRTVIIKQMLMRSTKMLTQRFEREARIMLDFRHENIVPVYDHFKDGSSYCIAMEFVDGLSLEDLIERKKTIAPMIALLILNEICKGLKYAHEKGVIHRDIKPDNVLVSKNGEVKLVDFGIATIKSKDEEELTKTGMVLGTPAYMSPEQLSDSKSVDKRSDIYSVGVLLYQMITGEKPFASSFSADVIHKIAKGIYVKPHKINPSIPRLFKRVVKKAMHHKAKRRYKDLQDLIRLLSKCCVKFRDRRSINGAIREYISTTEPPDPSLLKIPVKGFRILTSKIVAAVLLVILLAAGWFFLYYKGYYYELFRNRDFGSLEILAPIPADHYKAMDRIYGQANLVFLDAAEKERSEFNISLFPSTKVLALPVFEEQEDKDKEIEETAKEKEKVLTSNTLFLPSGNYSLVLNIENHKYFKSFYLKPRAIQRQSLNTLDRRVVQIIPEELPKKSISFKQKVMDSGTGESIYDITKITFKLEDAKDDASARWIDWKLYHSRYREYLYDNLKSGREYKFKFEAPSYYSKTVSFFVERDLDSAQMEVSLIRKPGVLQIDSDTEGLAILIDNRKEDYLGETTKDFVEFGNTVSGKKEFFLTEGDYVLTVKKDNKHFENHRFSISSMETVNLTISYEAEEKKISILPKK